ncbi:hypothetical protein [Leptolyngbya sp. GGD]|uniref:hypothetical protein n=1 Tax=Leptolyngbya sp. GGD TaxID=2997907 RepID=UPI00227A9172|nr:hypothetical protein [Leptolyngbya sp. GGD]MCY6494194.1 hypothetical protein [Leptolyngbya sp. GGD]
MSKPKAHSHDSFDFAHHAAFVRRHRAIRGLILDYALGMAIVGLNPIPNTLWLTLLIAVVLLVKMSRDVGKKWGFPAVYDPLAFLGVMLGVVGAFVLSVMVFLVMLLMGHLFPLLSAFTISVVLFTLTWAWGQTIHHFFANGFPKRTHHRTTQELPSTQDRD